MSAAPGGSYSLVIFDCDGVLVDSEPIANAILGAALRAEGLDLDDRAIADATNGLAMASVLDWAEARLGRSLPKGFLARVQTETFAQLGRSVSAMPGIEQALDAIVAEMCVASSGELEKMRLTLGRTGLLSRFEGRLFSASQVRRGKPHPDLFLHAAHAMGHCPAACAVIEDSLPGVAAAVAAGIDVFAYAPAGDGTAHAAAGATPFDDFARLPALLAAPQKKAGP